MSSQQAFTFYTHFLKGTTPCFGGHQCQSSLFCWQWPHKISPHSGWSHLSPPVSTFLHFLMPFYISWHNPLLFVGTPTSKTSFALFPACKVPLPLFLPLSPPPIFHSLSLSSPTFHTDMFGMVERALNSNWFPSLAAALFSAFVPFI